MKKGDLTQQQRDACAIRAWQLRQQGMTFEAIGFELDTSQPTARNLVGRGQTLAEMRERRTA